MAPIRGWGIKGERLKGFAPDGRWRTLTFLAALRANALTAPCVVDGPINGVIFRAYVEQFLRAGASPWRHRRPRQPRQPSCAGDTRRDPRRRRQARVPAALLAGLQSDRAGLRQGQALAAHGPGALHRPRARANASAARWPCRCTRAAGSRKFRDGLSEPRFSTPATLAIPDHLVSLCPGGKYAADQGSTVLARPPGER